MAENTSSARTCQRQASRHKGNAERLCVLWCCLSAFVSILAALVSTLCAGWAKSLVGFGAMQGRQPRSPWR